METKKCGDCFHADVCEEADTLVGFSRANPAYCGMFLDNADVVEVVRCKDCKNWEPSGSMAGNSEDDMQPIGGCEWANCCRKANDFCSYGEKRDGGNDDG